MKVLDKKGLMVEANRCYLCKNPRCKKHCPISTPIPEVIQLFKEDKIEEAGEILFNNNILSAICGIVCPHEDTCYGNCIRGIKDESVQFFQIERYVSGLFLKYIQMQQEEELDQKVAIVGSGPAGIALSIMLAKKGYQVTIFEKNPEIGGVLRYGIPEFRLPREKVEQLEKVLSDLNVKIRYNTLVGPVITLDKILQDNYDAVFIGTGVWNPKPLNIKGETLGNSHYAIDYLGAPKSYKLGDKVIVVGAGNVAMDAARTAKYYGVSDVTVVYRKDYDYMTATKAEIKDSMDEGVSFEVFKSPVEITDEGMIFIDTKKVEDEEGNVRWENIEGSEKLMKADSIIIAVSQGPKRNIVANTKNLEIDNRGLLITDEHGHTSRDGVFSCGDVVTGARTIVEAVSAVKKVAKSIDEYCKQNREK